MCTGWLSMYLPFGANSCRQVLFRLSQFHLGITFWSTSEWHWVSQFAHVHTFFQKTGNPGVLIKTFTCVGHLWPFWPSIPHDTCSSSVWWNPLIWINSLQNQSLEWLAKGVLRNKIVLLNSILMTSSFARKINWSRVGPFVRSFPCNLCILLDTFISIYRAFMPWPHSAFNAASPDSTPYIKSFAISSLLISFDA